METYARSLVPLLPDAMPEASFTVLAGKELSAEWLKSPWDNRISLESVPVPASSRIRRSLAEFTTVARAARRSGYDLVHGLSAAVPTGSDFRSVVTIHDLIYHRYPGTSSRMLAFGQRRLTEFVANHVDRIIVPSQATAAELRGILGVPSGRIDVVPEGPGRVPPKAVSPDPGLRDRLGIPPGRLVLSVSARRPHKNLKRLIEALANVEGAVLVLPGYASPFDDELRASARMAGVGDRVVFCGWVSDSDLEVLYAEAECMAFPSLAEGFGLPVLEAMARGIPVVTSRNGALAEVSGDSAAYFDPLSAASISEALRSVLSDSDLREHLVESGLAQAERFSWSQSAALTAASYRRALQ